MDSPEQEKKADVRRPMNAFLIFCKRHRSMVREKNPDLDNRSVTRILGDLWANLGETEKSVYTSLAKQYKDAFMKANPDYKWHNPDKAHQTPTKMTTRPTNARVVKSAQDIHLDGTIMPGKLADPSKMGGLSLLLMAGQQSMTPRPGSSEAERRVISPDKYNASKSALLELAEMCANELQQEETTHPNQKLHTTKMEGVKKIRSLPKKQLWMMGERHSGGKERSKSESDSNFRNTGRPIVDILKLVQSVKEHDAALKEKTGSKEEVDVFASQSVKSVSKDDLTQSSKKAVPVPRVRSWSESAKDHGKSIDDAGDHSGYTAVKVKGEGERSRRMSQSETIAGCLSDQNDNAIVSCGKLVVDHIVEKLLATDIAQQAMKLKGVSTIEELKQSLMEDELVGQRILGESSHDGKHENSKIENLVENVSGKTETCTEVKKDYEPILRVPDVKSFLETNESQKRLASEALGADANEVKAKKRPVTLPLEEVKPESTEDAVTPETRGDKYEHDFLCGGEDDGKDRDESEGYQPVRKSRRRNRGQRYLELINEGIIQPSKERLAARRAEQTSEDESLWCYEDIVMEEEVQEVRRPTPKRSGSDSDALEEKKYKTGDFDLEAQIATLPACSLDPVSRSNRQKNLFTKTRHHSDGSGKKSATVTSPTSAPADITTLTLPPHVKIQSEPITTQAVSGSRKRKARKHSINHLLPVSQRQGDDKNVDMKQEEGVKESENQDSEEVKSSKDADSSSSRESFEREETPEVKKEDDCENSQSEDRTTDLSQSGDKSENCSQLGVRPTEQSQSSTKAGGFSQSGDEDAGFSQSGTRAAGVSQSGDKASGVSQSQSVFHLEKGCDKKTYMNTSESDVLDFRTLKSSVEVCQKEDKELSKGQSTSNIDEKMMQKQPNMSSGLLNLSDKEHLKIVDSPKAVFPSESNEDNSKSPTKGDNSADKPKGDKSGSTPCEQSLKSELYNKSTLCDHAEFSDSLKGDNSQSTSLEHSSKVETANNTSLSSGCEESSASFKGDNSQPTSTKGDNKSVPNSSASCPEEKMNILPASSTVNIVAFSSASAPTTVDIVSLTTTSVTQAVSLEVLGEQAESPTSNMTRSPLAAGSPSVGVVHS